MKHQDSPNTSKSRGEHLYEVEVELTDREGTKYEAKAVTVRAKSPVHARAKAVSTFGQAGLITRVLDVSMVDGTDAEESLDDWN